MSKGEKILRIEAEGVAQRFLEALEGTYTEAYICGSIRRRRDTVGDIDIVLVPESEYGLRKRVQEIGKIIRQPYTIDYMGRKVELTLTLPESLGAAVLYRTGSAEFNIYMRARAKAYRYKLNESGLWNRTQVIAGDSESSIFHALDMEYIEPERRQYGYWNDSNGIRESDQGNHKARSA